MGIESLFLKAMKAAGTYGARGVKAAKGAVKGRGLRMPTFGEGAGLAMTASSVPGLVGQGLDMTDSVIGTDFMGKRAGMRRLRSSVIDEVLDSDLDYGSDLAQETSLKARLGRQDQKPLFVPNFDFEEAQSMGLQDLVNRESQKLGAVASRQTSMPDLHDLYMRMGIR